MGQASLINDINEKEIWVSVSNNFNRFSCCQIASFFVDENEDVLLEHNAIFFVDENEDVLLEYFKSL